MDAESIRDSLLQVSDQLDRQMGGSLLHVGNREFLFDHTSIDKTKYTSNRRAIYLPVIRNHLYDQFALFDFSNASVVQSQRDSTTVPSQALFMLNSELVQQAARELVKQTSSTGAGDRNRLEDMTLRLFGRRPTEQEFLEWDRTVTWVEEQDQTVESADQEARLERAWQLFAHALLSSNEFIYLR